MPQNQLTSGAVTIQFLTPPLRDGGETPELVQASGRDSDGNLYVYDQGSIVRTLHSLTFAQVSSALLASLLTFDADTVRGSKNTFTWYDHAGASHTVRLTGAIRHKQTGPDRHRVELDLEEETPWAAPPATTFAAAKDSKSASPVWIIKWTINSVVYYFSAQTCAIAPWGITTKPWVSRFGAVREGITNGLDEYYVSDLDADFLVDPAASPNMETLATGYSLEETPASLYLWFRGATDAPVEKWRGHAKDIDLPDETAVNVVFEDETSRLRSYVGEKITRITFPSADPDDVGKLLPIVFGSVKKLPVPAVDAGLQTSLPNDVTSTQTSITVSDAWGITAGMSLMLDEEEVYVSAPPNGDTLTVTRGYNTTLAVAHGKGTIAWQVKTAFVYLFGTALDALPKVYGKVGEAEVDITAVASRYLGSGASATVGAGQLGGQHPSYPGRACVTIPGLITVQQAVDLLINDGIGINDALALVDTIAINDTLSVADTIGVSDTISISQGSHAHTESSQTVSVVPDDYVIQSGSWSSTSPITRALDGNLQTGGLPNDTNTVTDFYVRKPISLPGVPTQMRVAAKIGALGTGFTGNFSGGFYLQGTYQGAASGSSSTSTIVYSSWFAVSSWAAISASNTYLHVQCSGNVTYVIELWFEVQYDPSAPSSAATGVAKTGVTAKTGGAVLSGTHPVKSGTVARSSGTTKTGTVTLSGNSTANTLVGDAVLVDCTRNITLPGAVAGEILATYCGVTSFQQVGAFPGSYALNGAITEYRQALEWLNILAFQCRARFRMELGTGKLYVRPDTLTSIKTIPACRITSDGRKVHSRKKASTSDILNKVQVFYDRDWSKSGGDDAYRAATAQASDGGSITAHGERQRPELFRFDFVTSQAMAESVRDYYVAAQASRPWLHEFETFLDHSELKFGEAVTLGWAGVKVLILEAGCSPGNGTMDTVKFTGQVIPDIVAPTGSIAINGGASITNSAVVTLTLTASDDTTTSTNLQVMLANTADFAGAAWGPFAASKNHTLSAGDGSKTVYYKIKDVAGNVSSAYSTTIQLDTTPPVAIITGAPSNPTSQTGAALTVGGTDVTHYKWRLDAGAWSSEILVATQISLTGLTEGSHTVDAIGKDSAGNWQLVTSATSATWAVDTVAPVTTATPLGGVFSAPPNVTLTANEAATIYYTTDGSNPVYPPAGSTQTYTGAINVIADTTLKFRARDAAGNLEAIATQVYDLVMPSAPVLATPTLGIIQLTVPMPTPAANATSHDLRYSTDGGINWVVLVGVTFPFSHDNLMSHLTYTYQARGVNANGPGPWSTSVAAQPIAWAVSITPSNGALTITWNDLAFEDGYEAYLHTTSSVSYSTYTQSDTAILAGATSKTFTGLTNGTTYWIALYGRKGGVRTDEWPTPSGVPTA